MPYTNPAASAAESLAAYQFQQQQLKRQAMMDAMDMQLKQASLDKAQQEQGYNKWNAAQQQKEHTDIGAVLTPDVIQKAAAAGVNYNTINQPAVAASPAVTTPASTSFGTGDPGTTIGEGDAPAPKVDTPETTTPAVAAQPAQTLNAGTDEQQTTAEQKHYQKQILNTDFGPYSTNPAVKQMSPETRQQFIGLQHQLMGGQAGVAMAPFNPERADQAREAADAKVTAAAEGEKNRTSAAAIAAADRNANAEAGRQTALAIANLAHPTGGNQDKLEQEYRSVLMRPLAMRSGGLGLEDQKVNQAIHLRSLFEQNQDPKTGEYQIPNVLMTEIAMGLARLISPSGVVGEGTVRDISQATAKGDMAKAFTYLTGQPVTGSTQAVIKMFKDSIDRQGSVAEQNREGDMSYIRALAPTDLEEGRKAKLESAMLNTYSRASKQMKAQNPSTGETLLSDDGGKTWHK